YIDAGDILHYDGAESGFLCFSGPEIRIYRCVFFPGEYYFYRQINNNKMRVLLCFWSGLKCVFLKEIMKW
ncbi:hypothetical protein NL352_28010, partial [Klebsiella pneumoniae]|nr:hypothetical protein [Klebsiella pneumoniae]